MFLLPRPVLGKSCSFRAICPWDHGGQITSDYDEQLHELVASQDLSAPGLVRSLRTARHSCALPVDLHVHLHRVVIGREVSAVVSNSRTILLQCDDNQQL